MLPDEPKRIKSRGGKMSYIKIDVQVVRRRIERAHQILGRLKLFCPVAFEPCITKPVIVQPQFDFVFLARAIEARNNALLNRSGHHVCTQQQSSVESTVKIIIVGAFRKVNAVCAHSNSRIIKFFPDRLEISFGGLLRVEVPIPEFNTAQTNVRHGVYHFIYTKSAKGVALNANFDAAENRGLDFVD